MSAASRMTAEADDEPMICLFCGEPEHLEIFEIWSDHAFMLSCCCEGLHETIVGDMADDPAWARALLRRLGIEDLTGHRLRRLADDGCSGMVLDWQLRISTITLPVARAFINRHHEHCGAPVAWRFAAAVFNGGTLMGAVTVGNPVAPALNGKGVLEVNRLCIRRDTPAALRWNAASLLYGWSAREARRRGWAKIVTYTRADEDGTSLIAAGWQREARVRGRGWHSRRRSRSNRNGWIDKIRWSKDLSGGRRQQDKTSGRETPACAASMSTGWMMDGSVSASSPESRSIGPRSPTTAMVPWLTPNDRWDDAAWS